jgi:hypothetical protein
MQVLKLFCPRPKTSQRVDKLTRAQRVLSAASEP